MQPPPDKKRKLHGDTGQNKQWVEPKTSKENENDWGDDDDELQSILAQPENLSHIDDMVASSQQFNNDNLTLSQTQRAYQHNAIMSRRFHNSFKPTNATSNIFLVPASQNNVSGKSRAKSSSSANDAEELRSELNKMQQQLFSKDGEIKFLRQNISKLEKQAKDERQAASKTMSEKTTEYAQQKLALQMEINSLKAQLEFQMIEMKKTSFTPTSPTYASSQGRAFRNQQVKSKGTQCSLPSQNSPDSQNGFPNSRSFLETSKFHGSDGKIQRGRGLQLNISESNSDACSAGAIFDQQHTINHFTNLLNKGVVGCSAGMGLCGINVVWQPRGKPSNSPERFSHQALMDELAMAGTISSGLRVFSLGRFEGSNPPVFSISPSFVSFFSDCRRHLDDHIKQLLIKQRTAPILYPLPFFEKASAKKKKKNAIDIVLVVVRTVVLSVKHDDWEEVFKIPDFVELINSLCGIINLESVKENAGTLVICLEIVATALAGWPKGASIKFPSLLDAKGFVRRLLKQDDELENIHHHVTSLVINIVTSCCRVVEPQPGTCKPFNSECVLSLVCSYLLSCRPIKYPEYSFIQKQFYALISDTLSGWSSLPDGNPPCKSSCDCLSKVASELVTGLEQLWDVVEKSKTTSPYLNLLREGALSLQLVRRVFPPKPVKGGVDSSLLLFAIQRTLKKWKSPLPDSEVDDLLSFSSKCYIFTATKTSENQ